MSNGGFVDHVYDQVFKGCALTFPATETQDQAAFTALSIHASVKDVEEDQRVYAYKASVDDKALALASYLSAAASSSKLHETAATDKPPVDDKALALASHLSAAASSNTALSWGLDRINQCALPLDGIGTKQDATGVRVFIIDTGVRLVLKTATSLQ
jgi:hypothetical protein